MGNNRCKGLLLLLTLRLFSVFIRIFVFRYFYGEGFSKVNRIGIVDFTFYLAKEIQL